MSEFILRVIISDVSIQKMKLAAKPDTVDHLAEQVRQHYQNMISLSCTMTKI